MANSVILFNASSHLPTKLTCHNFTVWRTHLFSGLIGHNLLGFIDGSTPPPPQTILKSSTYTKRIPNPEYILWHRQDQLILNAMLGSCVDTIQPHISIVSSSQEAWERLLVLFANKSRSRVMSLKEPDDLALVDNPLSEDDLVLYTIAGVGPEFKEIVAAIRARDTPISFDELYDKLGDYELYLKKEYSTPLSSATANYTHRPNMFSPRTTPNSNSAFAGCHSDQFSPRGTDHTHGRSTTNSVNRNHWSNTHNQMTSPRSSLHCRFCDSPGQATNECRKLAHFLHENDVQSMYHVHSPQTTITTANATTFNHSVSPSWLFDTGASHHVTSDTNNLHTYTDYGGPDEIHISDVKLRHYMLSFDVLVIAQTDLIKYMLSKPVLRGKMGKWVLAFDRIQLNICSSKAVKGQVLADFLANHPCSNPEDGVIYVGIAPWKMTFDGSTTSQGAGAGIMLISPDGNIHQFAFQIKKHCSNNQAEYEALIIGLEILLDMHITTVQISGDSQLIKQLNREFKCNAPGLEMYFSIATYLLAKFDDVTITHISRINNSSANMMAQLASGLKVPEGVDGQWVKVSRCLPMINDRYKDLEMVNPIDEVQNDWKHQSFSIYKIQNQE
ncbi:hypothetical protein RJ640_002726 [Escallonia rubra]|uniref:RNase H type-1 domain-containing protein n=1 Tax=Escallonia rubra TaxID=112253 RepID=A0AA88QZI1_9ASTE|nr:hypothetical protein RJ640_002726 [Escallonia rubra]